MAEDANNKRSLVVQRVAFSYIANLRVGFAPLKFQRIRAVVGLLCALACCAHGAGARGLDAAERDYLLDREGGYNELAHQFASGGPEQLNYDPALLTLAAGIASRAPNRGPAGAWRREFLAWPKNTTGAAGQAGFYEKPVPAHCHWGSPRQKRIFIICGSSYSTWERGTWTNLTIELLRERFHDPHLVVFAGFLTPEFLALRSRHPALTTEEPARDLYARLRAALPEWIRAGRLESNPQIGLIGFSGGASLVISLLAEDACQSGTPLFDQGGIAFSPVLDPETSFHVLDRANQTLDERAFPAGRALTTPVFPDALLAILRGYTSSNPAPFLRLTAADATPKIVERKREMVGRFYREFQKVDLATVSEAAYPEAPGLRDAARLARRKSRLNYREYYRRIVFPSLKPGESFTISTRLEPTFSAIRRAPLYLVFAQDDPVLSRIDPEFAGTADPLPSRLRSLLAFASRQSNIRVFNPKRGAHMGYFLDRKYLQSSLGGFFGSPSL